MGQQYCNNWYGTRPEKAPNYATKEGNFGTEYFIGSCKLGAGIDCVTCSKLLDEIISSSKRYRIKTIGIPCFMPAYFNAQ